MIYQIKYSAYALLDLDKIYNEVYNSSLDHNIASNYINGIMDKIKEKEEFPESGTPLYIFGTNTECRYVIYKSYIAIYGVRDNSVLVYRIIYMKSDYQKILNTK